MSFAIVEVPAMGGDPSHPAAEGPAVLTAALAAAGHRLPVRRAAIARFADAPRAASIAVNRAVAEDVRAVRAEGAAPLVLAGSCDVAPGVVAGIGDPELGVVWIDAHADFNTPESSASGFWPGMTLAVLVGDCGEEVWAAVGGMPTSQESVVLVGVRSLSPEAEAERLRASAMHVVRWEGGEPQGSLEAALDSVRERVPRVYVHLDLDALDPTVGSGVADPPVPGGLSRAQLGDALTAVGARFQVAGTTIATYTPSRDHGATLGAAVEAVAVLSG